MKKDYNYTVYVFNYVKLIYAYLIWKNSKYN